MQVLVGMSGGVDSSVAAAMLRDEGHEVVGVTLKLWGGDSDSGCCSVSDVDDARRVAQQLGLEHLVFNFGEDFDEHVVNPYVADHAKGLTPNPCIECNRHLKFDRLLTRARALGFDAVATGHHALVRPVGPAGSLRICRGVDDQKDQSYVLHMLTAQQLSQVLLPIGSLTKDEVRTRAVALGLRTAGKPDSQDVCFISHVGGGRRSFLSDRIPLHPARVVDKSGVDVGEVDAVELVTVGQRRGLGVVIDGRPRYAINVDVDARLVVVGEPEDLDVSGQSLSGFTWVDEEARLHALSTASVTVQTSAHGEPIAVATLGCEADNSTVVQIEWTEPRHQVARGQSAVIYDGDIVLGGGIVS
jgi:tRNA-specific 2-thiouridylase